MKHLTSAHITVDRLLLPDLGFTGPDLAEKKLTADKEELEKQVASAKQLQNDDGGEGLNDLATNQKNSPQHLVTLPLFNG
ncbi:Transcription factor, MADS-box [Artemisia annua]|uniref:Transcription factor, MADS-box n=1 Tax=Artemisia annua TaxID=35608 RepID=A0A2U1LRG0_ARTAN|nr:Transcription factor, MADS-box [Artemisia annua]